MKRGRLNGGSGETQERRGKQKGSAYGIFASNLASKSEIIPKATLFG